MNHCRNLDNAVSSLINTFFRYIMLKFKLSVKRSVSASIFGLSKMHLMTADDRLTLLDTISIKKSICGDILSRFCYPLYRKTCDL